MKKCTEVLKITAFLALVSCAHGPSKVPDIQLSLEQQEQINRDALSIASKRLEQMVVQAKTNSTAANYLATDLFLKGNMSLLEGDFVTASVLFKHLVTLVPDDEFLQKKYAISLIRVGDLEESKIVLEKLYQKKNEEKVGLILAGVYTGMDQEKEARSIYNKILARNPRSEDACIFLAKSFAMAKETKKAIDRLQQCAKTDPKNGMYDYYLGKVYVDQGQIEKGIASFKRAHERQPMLSPAVAALGMIYEERERFDEAIKVYQKHLTKYPMDGEILPRMVQVLFLKERFDEVIPYAERLSDIEPDNLNLKVKLGVLYTDAKRYPEAVSVFKDLLTVAPQSDKILYYLGAIHQEMKSFQDSIEYFNQIPTNSGLYSDSSIQMANMLSSLAQEEFAAKSVPTHWQEAFLKHVNGKLGELKELRVEFSVIKSGYFESVGRYKDAMEALMVVQEEKGFSTQHKYYLANLYEKEKRFEESTALILGILEKEPKNAHAWNFLGYSLVVRGEEMDKAYEYIQKALTLSPEDGYIRDTLGWYYYKTGDVKKALTELTQAFSKVPDDIEILKHLAQVHRELKDFTKAKLYLESALKNARLHVEKQEIIATMEELENARLPASGN